MTKAGIVFPHQLFEHNALASACNTIYLMEEWLYFKQYNFHQQKIAFHRASMKFYESNLFAKKINVVYIDSFNELADVRKLIPFLKTKGITTVEYIDTTDYWLEQRISKACKAHQVEMHKNPTPMFLNSSRELATYFSDKKKMYQTDFYKHQRLSRNILIDDKQKPLGGKWTYDEENRLKYPKGITPPKIDFLPPNNFYTEAVVYTEKYFRNNYGKLNTDFIFPTTYDESKNWLQDFFTSRFAAFGAYEDAILSKENILHHSVLTPMLNVGLLMPQYINPLAELIFKKVGQKMKCSCLS